MLWPSNALGVATEQGMFLLVSALETHLSHPFKLVARMCEQNCALFRRQVKSIEMNAHTVRGEGKAGLHFHARHIWARLPWGLNRVINTPRKYGSSLDFCTNNIDFVISFWINYNKSSCMMTLQRNSGLFILWGCKSIDRVKSLKGHFMPLKHDTALLNIYVCY